MIKKYEIGDVVDLDDVAISPAARDAWQAAAQAGAIGLGRIARGPLVIPDEQGLWLPTGELEIFVDVVVGQGTVRISMKVPADHWVWADPSWRN